MANLRRLLEQLAERGTRLGADEVYARGRQRALVIDDASERAPSRRHRRSQPLLVTAAAVLVIVVGAAALWTVNSVSHRTPRREIVAGPSSPGATKRGGQVHTGGEIQYGLEAENAGGWCLPNAQLPLSGVEVASAIYDTLTVPTRGGNGVIRYVPYLAQSVEHDRSYTQWSIRLRPGVGFHNGEPLSAAAVKQNLDAYRSGVLFGSVLADVADVQVVDALTVKVVTAVPWVAFDAFLWSNGRLGIVAPAQLADPQTCAIRPIGTGPFRFVSWNINDKLVVERNPGYWQRDAQGRRLPYLDRIVFRPVTDAVERVKRVQDGELDVTHLSDGQLISRLRGAHARTVNLVEGDVGGEVVYTMLNVSAPPFDNPTARLALAYALDTKELIRATQGGVVSQAVQPFAKNNIGYVAPNDLKFPGYDPARAKQLARRYQQQTGRTLSFTVRTTSDPSGTQLARLIASQATAAGIQVQIDASDQNTLINQALGGGYQAVLWRNYPDGDPDTQSVWWESTDRLGNANVANFGQLHDPGLDRLLRAGRSETDANKRAQIYQDVSRRFADQMYNIWGWYTRWAFPSAKRVHGVSPPRLPTGESGVIINGVQPLVGLWVAR